MARSNLALTTYNEDDLMLRELRAAAIAVAAEHGLLGKKDMTD